MSDRQSTGFLDRFGDALIDAGYAIVPIKPGEKYPPFDGWQNAHPTKTELADWMANGIDYKDREGKKKNANVTRAGVGILTRDTPGVDIDVSDDGVVQDVESFINLMYGDAPVRIGRAPRRLMLFRSEEPFTKLTSAEYVDDAGEKQQIEILGDGQQFVAYHIHPDTGKPYKWPNGDGPHITPASELPLLTAERGRAICDEFERLAKEKGWALKPKRSEMAKREPGDRDDMFSMIGVNDKPDISLETLHEKILMVPNEDNDYDTWANIGMALCHHTDGSDEGLDMFIEWSRQSSKHVEEYCERKWPSFIKDNEAAEAGGRSLITARYVLKLAKEAADVNATEVLEQFRVDVRDTSSLAGLTKTCDAIKKSELASLARNILISDIRSAFKRITGGPLSAMDAKNLVRYENPDSKIMPRWLEHWVYMSGEDLFYNTKTQAVVKQTAFTSMYSRNMLSKKDVLEGRSVPESMPVPYALNVKQIPIVTGTRYWPGEDEIFSMNGVIYANQYTDRNVPEIPEALSKKEKHDIELVKQHLIHLFPAEKDREYLIDWMAYIVQNPGKRPNWAIMMQGVESDGKSFWSQLLGVVLGSENVMLLGPEALEDEYTGYAEGHQVVFVEEVRLQGHNRYDVLNKLKPVITNPVIPIRRMRTDVYNVPNMTGYMMATNFRDALPLSDNDSRYLVLFSRWQVRQALLDFNKKNPTYYTDLYETLESAGALRGWLMGRDFTKGFDATKRAPESAAKAYMVDQGKSEELTAIEDILAESKRWDMSRILFNVTDLPDMMLGMDTDVPATRTLRKLMSDAGFTYLGKIRIAGVYNRYWSQEPDRFMADGKLDTHAVRDWIHMDL